MLSIEEAKDRIKNISPKIFYNKFSKSEREYIISDLDLNFSTNLYIFIYGKQKIFCKSCGKFLSYKSWKESKKYCNIKCQQQDPEQKKIRSIKKYNNLTDEEKLEWFLSKALVKRFNFNLLEKYFDEIKKILNFKKDYLSLTNISHILIMIESNKENLFENYINFETYYNNSSKKENVTIEKLSFLYDSETVKKIKKQHGSRSARTLENYIKKYGKEQGQLKFQEYIHKNRTSYNKKRASKESTEIFTLLYTYINQKYNINKNIWFDNLEIKKEEWFICDNKKYYFYDFTMLDQKIIIEYHGETYHPNPKKLTKEEWDLWKNPRNINITADVQYKKDQLKKQVALNKGFSYYEIYSDSHKLKIKEVLEELKNIIDKHLGE